MTTLADFTEYIAKAIHENGSLSMGEPQPWQELPDRNPQRESAMKAAQGVVKALSLTRVEIPLLTSNEEKVAAGDIIDWLTEQKYISNSTAGMLNQHMSALQIKDGASLEYIQRVAELLTSCAGCGYQSDGPLQECYQHGEGAAKFYMDYAIGAMYDAAGLKAPEPETVSGNTGIQPTPSPF